MQTLSADNPDGKGPYAATNEKPTADDPDQHNPRVSVPKKGDGQRLDVHGGPVNHVDQSIVDAAEGEVKKTPQGP